VEEIKDSMLDSMASPASKTFSESRLRRPFHTLPFWKVKLSW